MHAPDWLVYSLWSLGIAAVIAACGQSASAEQRARDAADDV